ncbi:hypothetical protein EJ04DRAFT_356213 [Polyplosphaeria fusca]|uniref:Uncharacterized protein n=1 Tax=Polyplosphaeria fusca TaxID=682080 RepID=A0A9P4R5M5_9PLEO|nr:hypothetical protein EJ04DRAFT_356213 [Polyplosphaeria fusca]
MALTCRGGHHHSSRNLLSRKGSAILRACRTAQHESLHFVVPSRLIHRQGASAPSYAWCTELNFDKRSQFACTVVLFLTTCTSEVYPYPTQLTWFSPARENFHDDLCIGTEQEIGVDQQSVQGSPEPPRRP